MVKDFQEGAASERLFEQWNALGGDVITRDQFPRVARHVNRLHVGTGPIQTRDQFGAIHATHDNIGQKNVNTPGWEAAT
jgi:hypothetical protein